MVTDSEPETDEEHYAQLKASLTASRRRRRHPHPHTSTRSNNRTSAASSSTSANDSASDSDSESKVDIAELGLGSFPTQMFTPPEFKHRDLRDGDSLRMMLFEEVFGRVKDRIQVCILSLRKMN